MSNEDFKEDLTMLCFNAADIASIFAALVKSEQQEINSKAENLYEVRYYGKYGAIWGSI